MFLLSLFNVMFLMVLIWLITKVLIIEKYLKKNQGHIRDLFQHEIDRLKTKLPKEK